MPKKQKQFAQQDDPRPAVVASAPAREAKKRMPATPRKPDVPAKAKKKSRRK
jgi:hypothetical protein